MERKTVFQSFEEYQKYQNLGKLKKVAQRLAFITKNNRFKPKEFTLFARFSQTLHRKSLTNKSNLIAFGTEFLKISDFEGFFEEWVFDVIIPKSLSEADNLEPQQTTQILDVLNFWRTMADLLLQLDNKLCIKVDFKRFLDCLQSKVDWIQMILEMPLLDQKIDEAALQRVNQFIGKIKETRTKLAQVQASSDIRKQLEAKAPKPTSSNKDKYHTPELYHIKCKYKPFQKSAGDIRSIEIYPGPEDLSSEHDVFLNELRVDKVFKDNREYFETHFRLIREDFIQVLRDGFRLYQEQVRLGKRVRNLNVNIFEKVKAIK